MGGFNNWDDQFGRSFPVFDNSGEKSLTHAESDGRERVKNLLAAQSRAADAEATEYLAAMNCPADLIAWGKSHGIPTFAEMTWMAGFLAGWRMRSEANAQRLARIAIGEKEAAK